MYNEITGKFECKDLNNLNSKEKAQLLRLYAGKNAKKILTSEQLKKAEEIWESMIK